MDLRLAEAEGVHQTADMILVIADVEALLDGFREARGGPAVIREAKNDSTTRMNSNDLGFLVLGEPAGATRCTAATQTFDAFVIQGALPARRSGPANAELSRDPGLR